MLTFFGFVSVLVVFGILFGRVSRLEWQVGKLEQQIRTLASATRDGASVDPESSSAPPVAITVRAPEPEVIVPEKAGEIGKVRAAASVRRLPEKVQEITQTVTPEPPAPPQQKEPAGPNFFQRIVAGGFEELFGKRLPIWAGGITLAVAGLFIVKYSIEQGYLSHTVQVVLGLIFAAALIVGAEVSRRWKATSIDLRIPQALSGAGIASASMFIRLSLGFPASLVWLRSQLGRSVLLCALARRRLCSALSVASLPLHSSARQSPMSRALRSTSRSRLAG
jgi:uncharacterized membrane protein